MSDFTYTVWYDVLGPGQRGSGMGKRTRGEAEIFAREMINDGYRHTWIEDHEAERAKLQCLDGPEGCRGPVDYHSVDGIKAWPRCDGHFAQRLTLQEQINHKYGGDVPPCDFDPSYAGESWDEDY